MKGPVTQPWTHSISFMQQTVLLTAVRGPDGLPKYSGVKFLLRWYRRCILVSSLDNKILDLPCNPGKSNTDGGSFMGPSYDYNEPGMAGVPWQKVMDGIVSQYLKELDAIPHHFQMHLMHAFQIVGYKHPDAGIRDWFRKTYNRLVSDLHLWPESEEQMDQRLGDTRAGWLARNDEATVA